MPHTSMYVVKVSKNPNFGPKTSCFGPKWLLLVVQKFSKVIRLIGLIECFILRYHDRTYGLGGDRFISLVIWRHAHTYVRRIYFFIGIDIYISRPRTKAKKLEVRNFFRKKLFSGNDLKWSKMYFKAKTKFFRKFWDH